MAAAQQLKPNPERAGTFRARAALAWQLLGSDSRVNMAEAESLLASRPAGLPG